MRNVSNGAKIVVDAPMALSWAFADERDENAIAALRHVEEFGGVVPALWTAEVSNGVLNALHRKRISPDEATAILGDLRGLPIALSGDSALTFAEYGIARQYGLSAYDAAYLDLAVRHGLLLVTGDRKLSEAAKACNSKWEPKRSSRNVGIRRK